MRKREGAPPPDGDGKRRVVADAEAVVGEAEAKWKLSAGKGG